MLFSELGDEVAAGGGGWRGGRERQGFFEMLQPCRDAREMAGARTRTWFRVIQGGKGGSGRGHGSGTSRSQIRSTIC